MIGDAKMALCSICLSVIHESKTLHCQHSYCKECIEALLQFQADGLPFVRCPQCRTDTVLARGATISSLLSDTSLEELENETDNTVSKRQKVCEEQLWKCCNGTLQWYCLSCKHYFCSECVDHCKFAACRDYQPIFVKYSSRLDSFTPFCELHDSFHSDGCIKCADTFCPYCRELKHKGHDVMSFTDYTNKFKNPLKSKIQVMEEYIAKQKSYLEQLNTNSLVYSVEAKIVDKYIQQKKVLLLLQAIYILGLTEQVLIHILKVKQLKVKNDNIVTGDHNLLCAILKFFDDTEVLGMEIDSTSISEILDLEELDENISFRTFENSVEVEEYVHEALFKMISHGQNEMICCYDGLGHSPETLKENNEEDKTKHEVKMLVLSLMLTLDICEDKIKGSFDKIWHRFKSMLSTQESTINTNISTCTKLLHRFQYLVSKSCLEIMYQTQDALDEYFAVYPGDILKDDLKLPRFHIQIRTQKVFQNIEECIGSDLSRTLVYELCKRLDLKEFDHSTISIHFKQSIDESEDNLFHFAKLKHLNFKNCEEPQRYLYKCLKEMGLHGAKQQDPLINENDVISLMEKGFSLHYSIMSIYLTNNEGVDKALNWLIENKRDDSCCNHILVDYTFASDIAHPADATKLISMGFNELQAKIALKKTNNNVEEAAEWLFSRKDKIGFNREIDHSFENRIVDLVDFDRTRLTSIIEKPDTGGTENQLRASKTSITRKESNENMSRRVSAEWKVSSESLQRKQSIERKSSRRERKRSRNLVSPECYPETVMLYYLTRLAKENRKLNAQPETMTLPP